MHIQYISGPEILRDISIEQSNQVISYITNGWDNKMISELTTLSISIISAIRDINSSGLRRCCFCGELFDPKGHPTRSKCYKPEHFLPCKDCGKLIKVTDSYANYVKTDGRRCYECRNRQIGYCRRNKSEEEKNAIQKKMQDTMIERYGAANPLQVPEIRAKVKATVKEKYNVDNLSQSSEIQDKIRQNSQKRYNVNHYSQAPEIRAKMEEGMMSKYGVKHAQQCPEIQAQTKRTNLAKYGVENVFQNPDIRRIYTANHKTKYGVEWPHQRPDLIDAIRESCIAKYGAAMYPVCDAYMKNFISNPSKFESYKEFMADPEKFINMRYDTVPSVYRIAEDIGTTDSPIYEKLISIGKRDLATQFLSSMEAEVLGFLRETNPSLDIIKHDRTILEGKEIDIYLPRIHLGIECNPTVTHNSSFTDPWGNPPKHYKYHFDKSQNAMSKGIFLFHIFGYEWLTKKEIIKSQLANLLKANQFKIYGRDTLVKEVPYSESALFLAHNHRQGDAKCAIRLGLYSKDNQLLSLMTFGKMRYGIGKKHGQADSEYELVRFCNRINTSVVGAASKLFKHFVSAYHPDKVVSFSDVAHTQGKLYQLLGFNKVSLSDPGYVWANIDTDEWFNRVTCQKKNLTKLFNDVSAKDIQTQTESDIMTAHRFARVFDSGVIRWEWTSNQSEDR